MPEGDRISAEWLKEVLLYDCNDEDEGRDEVSVVEIPINDDLEEAAKKLYPEKKRFVSPHFGTIEYTAPWFKSEKDAFIAGAEWQKEQFEKNRLVACDAQTREEYERETDFVDKFITENLRTPTFSDAINYGIAWQKEKMMEGAVEGYVNYYEDSGGILMAEARVGCPYHMGDKVKIIIVPEKEDKK